MSHGGAGLDRRDSTNEEEQPNCFHAVVRGRVQRVGYRIFCREAAIRHGIRGWVRNRPNGTVEVHAEADELALTEFLTDLYRGPVLAHVSDIRLDWQTVDPKFDSFDILR